MKKIMILGSTGMAGQMVTEYFKQNTDYNIIEVSRTKGFIADILTETGLSNLEQFIYDSRPNYIINCIGMLVKESLEQQVNAFFVNGEFPYLIAECADKIDAKLIHISTDCVFDGKEGPYFETCYPTETSNYGKSKAQGEVKSAPHLTLRTSIIGPDTDPKGTGLFKWVTTQTGTIKGYTKVEWNGITTLELAKQIHKIIETKPDLSGLYHLTTDSPITKHHLLHIIAMLYKIPVTIFEDDTFVQNKCLVNNRKDEYDPEIPPLSTQIVNLHHFAFNSQP